jgi:hypothetical protein
MKMRLSPSKWISGMQSLFSAVQAPEESRAQVAMEEIRQAMLQVLGSNSSVTPPVIHLRVMYAQDMYDLWYLRGDVMSAVASIDGESIARRKLKQITDMFTGYMPKGLASRPSPLGVH